MVKNIKQKLKENLLVLVLLLTFLTKIAEWSVQYFAFPEFFEGLKSFWYIQLGFILSVAVILFIGFNYIRVKKKDYLLIPVIAYLVKEIYNFIFIYGRIINQVTIIALVLEPLMLFGIIYYLNKSWLKLK